MSDDDREQADETLQCALSHFHQQARSHGRQPQPSAAADEVFIYTYGETYLHPFIQTYS